MLSLASRRNTVLPEASPVGPLVVAKKSTAGSVKRGAYKQREDGAKHARITIDDDDGKATLLSLFDEPNAPFTLHYQKINVLLTGREVPYWEKVFSRS